MSNALCLFVVNESAVIRWDYGDAVLGTCKESIEGGNHFRYWIQNGDKANTCVSPSPSSILALGLMGDAWVAVLCLWLRRTRNLQQVRSSRAVECGQIQTDRRVFICRKSQCTPERVSLYFT